MILKESVLILVYDNHRKNYIDNLGMTPSTKKHKGPDMTLTFEELARWFRKERPHNFQKGREQHSLVNGYDRGMHILLEQLPMVAADEAVDVRMGAETDVTTPDIEADVGTADEPPPESDAEGSEASDAMSDENEEDGLDDEHVPAEVDEDEQEVGEDGLPDEDS
jgi:hypothetical protein